MIVVDDCTDNSRQVLTERYADHPRVRLVLHDQNQGHIRSYNEGLGLARGEFMGVLAADDFVLRPDAVARQVALFDAHPRLGMVYSAYAMVDVDSKPFRSFQPFAHDYVRNGFDEFRSLMFANYVPHSGTLVRRTCHEQIGWYDTALPHRRRLGPVAARRLAFRRGLHRRAVVRLSRARHEHEHRAILAQPRQRRGPANDRKSLRRAPP